MELIKSVMQSVKQSNTENFIQEWFMFLWNLIRQSLTVLDNKQCDGDITGESMMLWKW